MEVSLVDHDTFRAVTLQNDTISGAIKLLKRCYHQESGRAKLATAWMFLAGLFVLSVPTWLSAMTGYVADIVPYVQDQDDRWVNWKVFEPVIYTIHDGGRLGGHFQNDAKVTIPVVIGYDGAATISSVRYPYTACLSASLMTQPINGKIVFGNSSYYSSYFSSYDSRERSLSCKWMWALSYYVENYGLLAKGNATNTTIEVPNDSSSYTNTTSLEGPPLDIEFHPIGTLMGNDYGADQWDYYPSGTFWRDPANQQQTFNITAPKFYENSSRTLYTREELVEHGQCQQSDSASYQWGFSFYLLYLFVAALLAWTIGMWVFYLDAWLHSHVSASGRDMGIERAAFDLAHAMRGRIDTVGTRITGNKDLGKLMKDVSYDYSDLFPQTAVSTRWKQYKLWQRRLRRRDILGYLHEEMRWLLLLVCCLILSIASWFSIIGLAWNPWTSFLPVFSLVGILSLGQQVRGRWTVFALALLLHFISDAIYIPLVRGTYLWAYDYCGFFMPYLNGGLAHWDSSYYFCSSY
jgi:hypothetical protein